MVLFSVVLVVVSAVVVIGFVAVVVATAAAVVELRFGGIPPFTSPLSRG